LHKFCFLSLILQCKSIIGSVVECSPATRAARVQFPDDADCFVFRNIVLFSFLQAKIH